MIGKENNEKFRESFKQYKTGVHPLIDDFAADLFGVMFGDREHAVCHLEIPKYTQKKMIIIKLREQVQPRHRERFTELINCHFQACESKLRTKNPFADSTKNKNTE